YIPRSPGGVTRISPPYGPPGNGTPPSSTLGGASLVLGQRVRLSTSACPVRLWLATDCLSTLVKNSLSSRYLCASAGRSLTRAEWARYAPGPAYRIVCP